MARQFAQGSALAKATTGYVPRPSQIEFAKAVANAFENKSSLIAEAGTGTGKTFAYLVPALMFGGKGLVSTAAMTLQEQLYYKDIPAVVKSLGLGAKVALLKGRANYICLNRLATAMGENVARSRQEVTHIQEINKFAKITKTGDRSDVSNVPENSGIWRWVTSTKETCLGQNCPAHDQCFVFKARDKAREADILVINHHLFLADMALKDEEYADFLPDFDLVIFDEAHQLPSIATDFFADTLSLVEVRSLADELMVLGLRKLPSQTGWKKLSESVKNRCSDIRQKFKNLGVADDFRGELRNFASVHLIADPLGKLEEAIKGLVSQLESLRKSDEEVSQGLISADEILDKVDYWKGLCEKGKEKEEESSNLVTAETIKWFALSPKGLVFSETPLNNSKGFKDFREKQGKPWILTSATLSVDHRFNHFQEEMGLQNVKAKSWDSPFSFSSQGMLYIPSKMVEPNDPSFPEKVAKAAWPLIKEFLGKTFILCTTLRAMDRIADDLRMRIDESGLSISVLVQNELPKQELIRRFREDGKSILVGSMSFWEGVDIKGETLSLVVIDKIPFAPPDDPVFKGKSERLRAENRSPFMEYALPEAITHLKQGAGRLIRDSTDTGVLMICDVRILNKRYGEIIWRSLPDFARTKDERIVLDFIHAIKSEREGQ
ncbi:MAG: ATP-dependent DNA helicase [Burkholderiales bacterium]|nr:ATP-dependent DNA helicase [Burkholderiales bacterium]